MTYFSASPSYSAENVYKLVMDYPGIKMNRKRLNSKMFRSNSSGHLI
jgi:hypothetical protein